VAWKFCCRGQQTSIHDRKCDALYYFDAFRADTCQDIGMEIGYSPARWIEDWKIAKIIASLTTPNVSRLPS